MPMYPTAKVNAVTCMNTNGQTCSFMIKLLVIKTNTAG